MVTTRSGEEPVVSIRTERKQRPNQVKRRTIKANEFALENDKHKMRMIENDQKHYNSLNETAFQKGWQQVMGPDGKLLKPKDYKVHFSHFKINPEDYI